MQAELQKIASQFVLEGAVTAIDSLGEGFINDTFIIRTEGGAPGLRIRLMNTPAVHNLSGAHLETEAGDVLLTACKTEIHFEL